MYAVVGCNHCDALWVVEGDPETTACPTCEKRHRFRKLKKFHEAETSEAARDARSRLLAARSGRDVSELGSFSELGHEAARAGVSDEEYLEASGVDTDEVTAAGQRASRGQGHSRSRREVVMDALRDLDRPTEAEVRSYAAESGVPADYVEKALTKLTRAGEVSESGGRYRLL